MNILNTISLILGLIWIILILIIGKNLEIHRTSSNVVYFVGTEVLNENSTYSNEKHLRNLHNSSACLVSRNKCIKDPNFILLESTSYGDLKWYENPITENDERDLELESQENNKTYLYENVDPEYVANETSISNFDKHSLNNIGMSTLYWDNWTFITDGLLFSENNQVAYLNIIVEYRNLNRDGDIGDHPLKKFFGAEIDGASEDTRLYQIMAKVEWVNILKKANT